ncbi:MAG: NAD-dependent epimerase/dehydratase family protein [Planctomycetes bacterium]|nr:NAD-dependent epimerase/dehydratase family protein [Planctomycetota bacterium]
MFDIFRNSKVLVAGGAGFVGVNLINRLLESGAFVTATLHNKPAVIEDKRIRYLKCDLTKTKDCAQAVEGTDYVFMCAANTSGAAVMEKTPLVHVTPNIVMNTLMLEAAYEAGVQKFLFISSNTVYPIAEHFVKEDEMIPGQLFEKYFCVGWMKQFSEVLCRMYAEKIKKAMNTIVVRPANIYGPNDDFEWETSHVLPALIRKVVERHNPIEVWGDGNDIKDFIYIDDFVEGILLAMEKLDTFVPVNIATGVPCSIKQALDAILQADKYTDANIVFNNMKPTMIPKRLIDTTRAKQLFDFKAKTSIIEGIEKTINWYRQTKDLARPKSAINH